MPATYECIATTTLTSPASSVSFSSISGSYTDIRAIVSFASTSASYIIDSIRLNNDTGNNYSFLQYGIRFPGGNATFTTAAVSNDSVIYGAYAQNDGGTATIYDIYDYANTTTYKSIWSSVISWTGEVTPYPAYNVGAWRNTSAVTTITFTGAVTTGYAAGSTFTLYGIKKA